MRSIMALFLLFSEVAWAQKQPEALIDKVVAVVNGTPLLHSQVQEKITRGLIVSVSDYPAKESDSEYTKALQDLINQELIMQEARDLEIEIRDEDVENEIKAFLESRGLSKDSLIDHLKQQGMTYQEYTRDFHDQMILRRFQGRVIAPLIKITDKDVETFYLKTSGASTDAVELVLRQIILNADSSADPLLVEQKKLLAEDIHKKLKNGMLFEDAVRIYSDDSRARDTGGLMAGIKAKDLGEAIRVSVEALQIGGFTGPIRTSLGWHIFKLEEKKVSSNREFYEKRKLIENDLRVAELAKQTQRWLADQRQKSKIELIDNR